MAAFRHIVLIVILCASSAFASIALGAPDGDQAWQQAGDRRHSIQDLGEQFYVTVPVKNIENAELALFDFDLAKLIRLPVDENWQAFEAKMKKLFAVETDKTGTSPRKMIATYYQDSKGKEVGDARGDGRAVWSGEIALPTADGGLVYLDVVIKGIDETPLAWTKNATHSGGKQSILEGATSFVMAKANRQNGLDSTGDLMTFIVRDAAGKATRSITVRIGKQTRMAHPRFHADNPDDFKTMIDYIITRDLGLPLGAAITQEHVDAYVYELAKNLAEEEARYDDLNAIHGSPTAGNRTSGGATIDLVVFWYLDGFHGDFSYLYGRANVGAQRAKMLYYLNNIKRMMKQAGYENIPAKEVWVKANKIFIETYSTVFTEARLMRMGFTIEQVRVLPEWLRDNAFEILFKITTAQSSEKKLIAGQEIYGAAFDSRRVLSSSVKVVSKNYDLKVQIAEVFANDRSWSSKNKTEELSQLKLDYLRLVKQLIRPLKPSEVAAVVARAALANSTKRHEMGDDFFHNSNYFKSHLAPLIDSLQGAKSNFAENQRRADIAVNGLVDPLIKPRDKTNLTGRVRATDTTGQIQMKYITKKCIELLKLTPPPVAKVPDAS